MSLSLFHMISNCHVCYFVIIFLLPIWCRNVDKHWFCTFIAILDLACHSLSYVACRNLPQQGLLPYPDEPLSDYFMVDYMYVAHSKFNASNTPKE